MHASRLRKWLLPCLLALVPLAGCHRAFYRCQADRQVEQIVDCTQIVAGPVVPQTPFTIEIDPRSRMFDPFSRDYPPMPHDDPAAHTYMHCVDGHRGYRCWHKDGDTYWVENPMWPLCKPCEEEALVLDAKAAVELAWINSREYQAQLEDVYIAALNVSFEQFRFESQFFGGLETFFTSDGPERSGVANNSLEVGSDLQMNKLFATGGELVVGFANSLVWEFTGSNDQTATTLFNFSFIQPLLRGAGRDVVLEQLTQSQRNLLADVRSLERFRLGFYTNLVTGRGGAGATVAPGGGFLGLLQTQQNIRNQEFNISQLESSLAQLEAFYEADRIDFFQVELARQSLFDAQSRLLNSRVDYQNRLDSYKLALGIPPSCPVRIEDPIIEQFNLVDMQLIPAQRDVARLQNEVGEAVVGMLPGSPLSTPAPGDQGSLIERHRDILLAVELQPAQGQVEELEEESPFGNAEIMGDPDFRPPTGGANRPAEIEHQPGLAEVAPAIPWSEARAARLREILALLDEMAALRDGLIETNVPRARADIAKLRSSVDERLSTADELREQLARELSSIEGGPGEVDPGILDVSELEVLPDQLNESLAKIEIYLDQLPTDLDERRDEIRALLAEGPELAPGEVFLRLREDVFLPVPHIVEELSAAVLELTLIQARARTESVVLIAVDLPSECALEIARLNRRDWMNQRAATVDAWRQIAVTANDLESDLDVVFNGDIGNVGDQPFNIQGETGRLQVGLEFDAPLTRLVERNAYRASLISFEQARRAQYAFEDEVSRSLRSILRTLEVNRLDFELQRRAVQVAIQQVELTRLRLQEPPRPGETQQQASPTTTRDLVDALSRLLQAQNTFLAVWVDYESLRRQLDFEMGTMQLDADGMWIDPGEIDDSICPPEWLCPPGGDIPCAIGASSSGQGELPRSGQPRRNSLQLAGFHEEVGGLRGDRRRDAVRALRLRR